MTLKTIKTRKFKNLIKGLDKECTNTIQLLGLKIVMKARDLYSE